jgi:hypothetical protein
VSIFIHSREHLPPHVHVIYGEFEAIVNIRTGVIIQGYIPAKKLKFVEKWLIENNNKILIEENFYELNPMLRPKKNKKRNN